MTGAAGAIGRSFYVATLDQYSFRLADLSVDDLALRSGHEVARFNVGDLAACRVACAGIDTVVHLAADPSPEANFHASLLSNNIAGTFNVFRAAADAGCRRVVFASSLHAVAGYPLDEPVPSYAPVRPVTMYGVSKCFGEATAHYFARTEGLSSIAVRIGAYQSSWMSEQPTVDTLSAFVSVRDLNQLLERCIEASDIEFAIVHGISDNRIKRVDISQTVALLGYRPQDDGFALYPRV